MIKNQLEKAILIAVCNYGFNPEKDEREVTLHQNIVYKLCGAIVSLIGADQFYQFCRAIIESIEKDD